MKQEGADGGEKKGVSGLPSSAALMCLDVPLLLPRTACVQAAYC